MLSLLSGLRILGFQQLSLCECASCSLAGMQQCSTVVIYAKICGNLSRALTAEACCCKQ